MILLRLKVIIQEHNSIYINFFGNLKPKFHHLIHYHKILGMSGPLCHFWSMRAEQKHRKSKLTANVSCSFKNIFQTLMFKSQLRMSYLIQNSRSSHDEKYGPLCQLPSNLCNQHFPSYDKNSLFYTSWNNYLGTLYKPHFVVILRW